MKKNPKIFLEHILESIRLIEEYSKDKTKDDFRDSFPLQDMIIRRLEIIGEAVKNLPQELKDNNTNVQWKRIAGMRDKLIHEYNFGIDIDFTWGVVEKEIPILKERILKILESIKDDFK